MERSCHHNSIDIVYFSIIFYSGVSVVTERKIPIDRLKFTKSTY
jgi:hypothetical protein